MSVLFKSPEARATVEQWHERFRAQLTVPTESRTVETPFGLTHLLVTGPESGPPLVVLHGAMASSAHLLVELAPLLTRYRVYAIDVIGQSVKSADVRLPVNDDSYGRWLLAVLDALALERPSVLGVSWGGFVALRLAALAAHRIEKLVLMVPAGLVTGSAWAGLWRIGWPMLRYQMKPNPQRLLKFMANLLTTLDDDWLPYLGDAFLAYRMDMKIPMLAKDAEFKAFTVPTFVLAADDDVSFPGNVVVARAKVLFPSLRGAEVISGCKHSPPTTDTFRQWLAGQVTTFLEAPTAPPG